MHDIKNQRIIRLMKNRNLQEEMLFGIKENNSLSQDKHNTSIERKPSTLSRQYFSNFTAQLIEENLRCVDKEVESIKNKFGEEVSDIISKRYISNFSYDDLQKDYGQCITYIKQKIKPWRNEDET